MLDACHLTVDLQRPWSAADACALAIDLPQTATQAEPVVVSAAWYGTPLRGAAVNHCLIDRNQPRSVARRLIADSVGEAVLQCRTWRFSAPTYFAADSRFNWSASEALAVCRLSVLPVARSLAHSTAPVYGNALAAADCTVVLLPFAPRLVDCQRSDYSGSAGVAQCRIQHFAGAFVGSCVIAKNSDTVPPPCEYHRIIVDPPPPVDPWLCGERPDPCDLSVMMNRPRPMVDACNLAIDLACTPIPSVIPVLRSYLMQNTVTLTFNGLPVDCLRLNLKTDRDSWCWQLSADVPPAVFDLFDIDGRTEANPAVVDVHINGYDWRFMLDDYSDNRVFGKKTYTVTGVSLTAQLAGNHARKTHTYTAARNARQLIDAELDLTGFSLPTFNSVDWLVPANTYSYSNRTPMAVINDIAKAAGCYVQSHRVNPTITVNKRLPVTTWQLAAATPDVIVPSSVIYAISGSRNSTRECNGVFVHGQTGGIAVDATRAGTDGTPRLATQVHALITAEAVGRQAAAQALSATGRHKTETLTLPLSQPYHILLAEMGQLWQVDEAESWKGQVIGISVSAERGNGHKVTQQVSLDRYLGGGNA